MDDLEELRDLLRASSDPDNPSPEELRDLFDRCARIAVVGLSRSHEKPARRVPSYLAAKGYDIVPVNPHAQRIFGKKVFASLQEVPASLDMVIVFRPSEEAGGVTRTATARAERPAIWLQEGIRADEEVALARAGGHLCVQDLCAYHVHRALYS